jgi:hypothetical protein
MTPRQLLFTGLLLISPLQYSNANTLSLNCDILNQARIAQSEFSANDTAVFKINASLENNDSFFNSKTDYKLDFKVSANVNIKGFMIPLKLNQSFSVPVRGVQNPFVINEEKSIKLPPIHGSLTLNVTANVNDNSGSAVSCEKSLSIK